MLWLAFTEDGFFEVTAPTSIEALALAQADVGPDTSVTIEAIAMPGQQLWSLKP